jgi:hypothetical protein
VTKRHRCNWPGCSRHVKARDWACPKHWNRLPKRLRAPILAEAPSSPGGLGAHADAIAWVRALPEASAPRKRTLRIRALRAQDRRRMPRAPELAELVEVGAIRGRGWDAGVDRGD